MGTANKLPHCFKVDCPLLKAPGPVWGEGNREQAKIIYIAQNPGQAEVSIGRPMIGPSGNVLNRQLFEAGIRRSEMYITNQVKCLTPGNRVPTDVEIKCCKPILMAEMKACKADTVVLSGAVAFKENVKVSSLALNHKEVASYVPSDNIMNRRGCVEVIGERKFIGTIHPAFIMRMPEFRACGPDDLKKAISVAGVKLPKLDIRTHVTKKEAEDYRDYILHETKSFSYDVETFGFGSDVEEDDYVAGQGTFDICGFSADGKSAIVLDREQTAIMDPVFRQPDIWRYEHNGPYDHYHVSQVIPEPHLAIRFDTMLAEHYWRSYAPKKLKPYVLSVHTKLPYYDRKLEGVNRRFYNAMDVLTTYQAGVNLRKEHDKWKITQVFQEYGQPILPILEEWRAEGLRVDMKKFLIFKAIMETRIQKCQMVIAKLVGPFFNPGSPKQLGELLYDKWKLPEQFKGTGAEKRRTTDNEARKRLRHWIEERGTHLGEHKIPFYFLTLMDYISGEEQKLQFLGRVSLSDQRIHAYFKAHGTESFRLSSKPNVQNIPVYDIAEWGGARSERAKGSADPLGIEVPKGLGSLRSLVIPDCDEDWILTIDFEQLQLWIYAFQWKVKWLMDLFHSREYIYGIVYEKLYGEPFFEPGMPKTKKHKLPTVAEQRIRRAKAVPLGFLFKRTGEAVAEEYGWTPQEGRNYRSWFYGLNPELEVSYDAIEFKLKQQGWIRHIFGQIMHFPNMKLSEAINSHAQSPEAFIMLGSIIRIHNELIRRGLRAKGNRLMLSVHDSLSLNVKTEDVEEVYEEVVAPILNRPIPELGGISLRHSAEMSKTWDWETIDYYVYKQRRRASSVCDQSPELEKPKHIEPGVQAITGVD